MENRVKKAKKDLEIISHNYIRTRDSVKPDFIGGFCFDCDQYDQLQQFQCGHWIPNSCGGALLRFHPDNMHGQIGKCNCHYNQEFVKINYTMKMEEKYGTEYCNHLKQLKNKSIKADIFFYENMIELYKRGDEKKIVEYLENLAKNPL